MTDLNELSKFEKDLKNLIESRNNFQPRYVDLSGPPAPKIGPRKLKDGTIVYTSLDIPQEKLEEHHRMGKMGMFMGVPEHGQPYRRPTEDVTYMGVAEHGQPYREQNYKPLTENTRYMSVEDERPYKFDDKVFMLAGEHGQPYRDPGVMTLMVIGEHGQPYKSPRYITRMAVSEHGQPYRSSRYVTKMSVREHGKPFMMTNMAIGEHGQPYRYQDDCRDFMCISEHGNPYRGKK